MCTECHNLYKNSKASLCTPLEKTRLKRILVSKSVQVQFWAMCGKAKGESEIRHYLWFQAIPRLESKICAHHRVCSF